MFSELKLFLLAYRHSGRVNIAFAILKMKEVEHNSAGHFDASCALSFAPLVMINFSPQVIHKLALCSGLITTHQEIGFGII